MEKLKDISKPSFDVVSRRKREKERSFPTEGMKHFETGEKLVVCSRETRLVKHPTAPPEMQRGFPRRLSRCSCVMISIIGISIIGRPGQNPVSCGVRLSTSSEPLLRINSNPTTTTCYYCY